MFGLSKLMAAFSKLASHANALAATLAEINDGLRSTLHLDAPARKVLASPEEGNGKVARKAKEVIS